MLKINSEKNKPFNHLTIEPLNHLNNKNNLGFSLIELIVVMTIVVIISVAGIVNFSGSSKKARDTRRVSDLEKIRIALEFARQVGNTYPVNLTVLETNNYITKVPNDPKTGLYLYTPISGYAYTLDATMEDLGSTNGSYGSFNYRVSNP